MIFAVSSSYAQIIQPNPFTGNGFQPISPASFSSDYFRFSTSPIISPDFYAKKLGFFCKREWQFESRTKLPLRLRLGSVAYTDWMEGKKGALMPLR